MIKLYSKNNRPLTGITHQVGLIGKVTTNPYLPEALRKNLVLRWNGDPLDAPEGFGLVLVQSAGSQTGEWLSSRKNIVEIDPSLDYITDDDVIKFQSDEMLINVLYRRNANSNSFLVTERCNSFCVMCSQPPRAVDDRYHVDDMLQALPLIHPDTHEIGITGGEPTLWGNDFIKLVQASKAHLPRTSLHVLSNGRNFKDLSLAVKVAKVKHPDIMFGIPLYADYSQLHDFIVQADNAFDDTIRGILNLKRCRVPVEIRVVIHRQNFHRLPRLAEFLVRNLLFVDHVALMGMEIIGFGKSNLNALWIDPYDYQNELQEAVETLTRHCMRVSIYNTPLCVIPENIRSLAVRSISDWKNDFLQECEACSAKKECGGFFTWNLPKCSSHIRPIH